MKIEMGESLVRSWLRHVEHCEFAELNWKASPAWQIEAAPSVEDLFESAKAAWPEAFGKNRLSQLLKQAEIDVLGLNTRDTRLHLVDIAYHSGGLNYGGADTGKRIFKKLIRSILVAMTYFPQHQSTVYFMTPFASPAVKNAVENAKNQVAQLIPLNSQVDVQIFIGDDFKFGIMDEVLKLGSEVADTSELFLRSWQLFEPLQRHYQTDPQPDTRVINTVRTPENREPCYIAALYLSRFGHFGFSQGNQAETFAYFGRQLGVAGNTIKNYRDRFDRYVDNHRAGWDVELPSELQRILDEYGNMPEDKLRRLVMDSISPDG